MRDAIAVALIALGGCWTGNPPPAPVTENHREAKPPPPPPPPPSLVEQAIAKLEDFTRDMCACPDKACADGVQDAMTEWARDMAMREDHSTERTTEDQTRRMADVGQRYGECMAKALSGP